MHFVMYIRLFFFSNFSQGVRMAYTDFWLRIIYRILRQDLKILDENRICPKIAHSILNRNTVLTEFYCAQIRAHLGERLA